MIKKIKIEDLKIGMFIADINARWCHHPFLTRKKRIKSFKHIEKIKKYEVAEVFIDTELGLDCENFFIEEQEEANKKAETKLEKLFLEPVKTSEQRTNKILWEEQLKTTQRTYEKAKQTIADELNKIRLGKPINTGQIENTISSITESILADDNSMIIMAKSYSNDEYTFKHSINVAIFSIVLGKRLNFSRRELQIIGVGSLLHDCGKMKIQSSILNKPEKLNVEEFEEIRKHPVYGKEILESARSFDRKSILVALHHHEKYSGGGYPNGSAGDKISLFGMMVAIADVYDALTSLKPYRKAILPFEAVKKLFEFREDHLNPDLVEHFIKAIGIYPIGSLVRMKNNFIGIVASNKNKNLLHPAILLALDDRCNVLSKQVIINNEPLDNNQQDEWSIVEVLNPDEFDIDMNYYLHSLKKLDATA